MARHNPADYSCPWDRQAGKGWANKHQGTGAKKKNAVGRVGSRAGMSTGMVHRHKFAVSPSGILAGGDLLGYSKNLGRLKILGKVVRSSRLGLFQERRLTKAWQSLGPQKTREY